MFLASLIDQREEGSHYALAKNVIPVFAQFGLDTSIFDHYKGMWGWSDNIGVSVLEEDLSVQVLPVPDRRNVITYAVLRLNVESEGLALIFEREVSSDEWVFTGWFPCAESGFSWELDSEVAFAQVQDDWYLRVSGRRDHGTERQSEQTDWYDLTNRTHALGYMSLMHTMRGDKDDWLGHSISSTDTLVYKDGKVTLAVSYSGILMENEAVLERDSYDYISEEFYAQDWQVEYVLDSKGSFIIEDEQVRRRMWPISLENPDFNMSESIPAKDIFTLFPDIQKTIEDKAAAKNE